MINLEEIEIISRKSINILKEKYELPAKGLLAGGSIANMVASLIWNDDYPINDIDIFYIEEKTGFNENPLFKFKKEEAFYYEDYNGILNTDRKEKKYYQIIKSENNGIFNNIYCESRSSDKNYELIIDSFDLNCVKIGYVIEEDRFIISKDFKYFLNNKIIKLTNLNTPHHTAIRLAKKLKTLNIPIGTIHDFEFKIIQHCIKYNLSGIIRTGFKEKYKKSFYDNKNILEKYFHLVQDYEKQARILEKYGNNDKVYTLSVIIDQNIENKIEEIFTNNKTSIIIDENLNNIYSTKKILTYLNHFSYSEKLRKIWKNLFFIKDNDGETKLDRIDDMSDEDIILLKIVAESCVNSNNLLKNMSLIERINYIKLVISYFNEDSSMIALIFDNFILNGKLDELDKDILKIKYRKDISYYINRTSRILNTLKKEVSF
jgi:hypothetical protein